MRCNGTTGEPARLLITLSAFLNDFIRPGQAILDTPVGLAFFDDAWFVSSASRDNVLKFDRSGQLLAANFIAAGLGGIDAPTFLTGIVPEPSAHAMLLVLSIVLLLAAATTLPRLREKQRRIVNDPVGYLRRLLV
jgi:hypothetical protein